jgi:tetratricopeptide (TPR) repeat protein
MGLTLAERGLKRAPNHPVMLQIKADMLYRLERYDEAAAIYEKSAVDYLERTGKSIRYWCAVLNLIRIYHDAGDETKSAEQRKKLDDPDYQKLKKWMPSSLVDDLKDRKLI